MLAVLNCKIFVSLQNLKKRLSARQRLKKMTINWRWRWCGDHDGVQSCVWNDDWKPSFRSTRTVGDALIENNGKSALFWRGFWFACRRLLFVSALPFPQESGIKEGDLKFSRSEKRTWQLFSQQPPSSFLPSTFHGWLLKISLLTIQSQGGHWPVWGGQAACSA